MLTEKRTNNFIGVTMFEKEAEEYAIENWEHYEEGQNDSKALKQAYLAGAEFGYNNANEWHYPSKGEYPKEYENVLCCCKVVNAEFYSIGHTIIGGDNKIRWWSSDRSEKLNVIAWKEIDKLYRE